MENDKHYPDPIVLLTREVGLKLSSTTAIRPWRECRVRTKGIERNSLVPSWS
jgi:hypothetical protein